MLNTKIWVFKIRKENGPLNPWGIYPRLSVDA
jgi:hypothetical protein